MSGGVLRWAGSKRAIVPALVDCMPTTFDRYFEPFAGSAALFFATRPRAAVLGDTNGGLVNFFRTLRDNHASLHSAIADIPASKDTYYALRSSQPLDFFEQAVRFGYLNRYCYNGIYRTNRSGHFNVPMGSNTGALPPLAAYRETASALAGADLQCASFQKTLSATRSGDFVYVDPPYPTDRQTYGEYGYSEPFPEEELVQTILELDRRGVFVLSTYPTKALTCDRPNFRSMELRTMRHVASKSAQRRRYPEYITWNYDARIDPIHN